jgi:hypothetical protein
MPNEQPAFYFEIAIPTSQREAAPHDVVELKTGN